MDHERLAILGVVGLFAAAMGAITGGNSLLTVPAMLLCGMEAKTAVATNMMAATALSAGATARFVRERMIHAHPTTGLIVGAVPGSLAGAAIALAISDGLLRAIISGAMLAMALFMAVRPRFGQEAHPVAASTRAIGYVTMAIWSLYGGMFSGGYTTVLTVASVALFGVALFEAVAFTKVVNFAGSAAATIYFAANRRIDWRVGLVMTIASLSGGWLGAHLAIRGGTVWLRRAMVTVVAALGVKLLWGVLH